MAKRKKQQPIGKRAWMAKLMLDDLVAYTNDDGSFGIGRIKEIDIENGAIKVYYDDINKTTTLTHLNDVKRWHVTTFLDQAFNLKV